MSKTLDPTLAALTPHQLMLVTLYGEARGEPIEGQVAVANVIKNRLARGDWGASLATVLGAWAQFSCLWPSLGGKNYNAVLEAAKGLLEGAPLSPSLRQIKWVVDGVLQDLIFDNTFGACHYYAVGIPAPYWATSNATFVAQKGRHLFYSGVK